MSNKNYVARNTSSKKCDECGAIHDFFSGRTKDRGGRCGTPIAYPEDKAREVAKAIDGEVEPVGNDMLVILDPRARKLPQQSLETSLIREHQGGIISSGSSKF